MVAIHVTDREQNQHTLEAYASNTLMETLRDEGTGVEAICGGQCACATCHCFIDERWVAQVGEAEEEEQELLESLDHYDPARSRLACQIVMRETLQGLTLAIAPGE
jgi:2Fe-2S ferredoxin